MKTKRLVAFGAFIVLFAGLIGKIHAEGGMSRTPSEISAERIGASSLLLDGQAGLLESGLGLSQNLAIPQSFLANPAIFNLTPNAISAVLHTALPGSALSASVPSRTQISDSILHSLANNTAMLQKAVASGDWTEVEKHLNNIVGDRQDPQTTLMAASDSQGPASNNSATGGGPSGAGNGDSGNRGGRRDRSGNIIEPTQFFAAAQQEALRRAPDAVLAGAHYNFTGIDTVWTYTFFSAPKPGEARLINVPVNSNGDVQQVHESPAPADYFGGPIDPTLLRTLKAAYQEAIKKRRAFPLSVSLVKTNPLFGPHHKEGGVWYNFQFPGGRDGVTVQISAFAGIADVPTFVAYNRELARTIAGVSDIYVGKKGTFDADRLIVAYSDSEKTNQELQKVLEERIPGFKAFFYANLVTFRFSGPSK